MLFKLLLAVTTWTPRQANSSIVWSKAFSGPARVAVDHPGRRFAVTDGNRIVVGQLA